MARPYLVLGGDIGGTTAAPTIANDAVTFAKMQDIATDRIIGRDTAGTGDPEALTVSQVLDFVGSAADGDILYRTGGAWVRLAKGTAGQVLQTNSGATAPEWTSNVGVSGYVLSSGATGVGYMTGAGGTVTQLTNKATAVTLNKVCGQITTHSAQILAAGIVSFTLTNSAIAATDCVIVNHVSGGTFGNYEIDAGNIASGSCSISIRNRSGTNHSDVLVIGFVVIKAVAA
jgi:hypothetical protein